MTQRGITMMLVIDNYDSFTYNLVHYFEALKQTVVVYRNDQITIENIRKINPSHIVLSPGPGRPEDAGITLDCINAFAGKIPILGICLGHQAIAQHFGANIINAKEILHGKTSLVFHNDQGVFEDLPAPFTATRYHSLVVEPQSLPSDLMVTAWTQDRKNQINEIMGIKHKIFPIEGVQFHPESILTEAGYTLLNNFILGNDNEIKSCARQIFNEANQRDCQSI